MIQGLNHAVLCNQFRFGSNRVHGKPHDFISHKACVCILYTRQCLRFTYIRLSWFPFKMFTCRGRPAWPCEIKKIDRSHCPAYTETKMDFNLLIMLLWLLDLKNGEKLSCTPSISSSSTSHANTEHQRQHFPHLQLASPLCLAGFRMISDFHKLVWSADDLLMSGQLLPAMPVPQPTAKPFAPSSRAPATGLRKMSWSEAVQIFADIKLETSRNHIEFSLGPLEISEQTGWWEFIQCSSSRLE